MKTFILLLCLSTVAVAQTTDTLVFNPKRAVALEGGSNFRDLGGYPAADGKSVKWGHIYRSADISKLTDADLQTLTARNIAVDCDLRGPDEIKTSPDRMMPGMAYLNLPAGSENVNATTASMMSAKPASRDSMMLSYYGRTDHLKAKYKPMFDQLLTLDDTKALMFHCTAGKDRTGMGAALILSALGVDKALIMKDYAATDVYWKQGRERVAQMMMQGGTDNAQMAKMLAADPAYLANFFATIDKKYGSMANFLTTEMELTPDKLATLRTKYLK